jgi:hypothetical protein
MKRILIATSCFASCLMASGCTYISGTMTVNPGQTLQLKDKKGQIATFATGNATVEMASGKLQIKGQNSAGKNDTVELDALKNLLPAFQTSGNHLFLAKDTGQPVDINEVTINSDSQSVEHEGWESCTSVVTVDVPCPPPPAPPAPGPQPPGHAADPGKPAGPQPPGKPEPGHASLASHSFRRIADVCTDSRVVSGTQHIQFHFDGDSFEIQLIMTDPSTNAQIASFDGYVYSSDKIVDQYLSPCIIH